MGFNRIRAQGSENSVNRLPAYYAPFPKNKPLYSPHTQATEGRAPVWGSEFTTQVATLQGDSADFAARLNVQFLDLTG
jgi:hypothetical protein